MALAKHLVHNPSIQRKYFHQPKSTLKTLYSHILGDQCANDYKEFCSGNIGNFCIVCNTMKIREVQGMSAENASKWSIIPFKHFKIHKNPEN